MTRTIALAGLAATVALAVTSFAADAAGHRGGNDRGHGFRAQHRIAQGHGNGHGHAYGHQQRGYGHGHAAPTYTPAPPVACSIVAQSWGHGIRYVKVCKPLVQIVPPTAAKPVAPTAIAAPPPAMPRVVAGPAKQPVAAPMPAPAPAGPAVDLAPAGGPVEMMEVPAADGREPAMPIEPSTEAAPAAPAGVEPAAPIAPEQQG